MNSRPQDRIFTRRDAGTSIIEVTIAMSVVAVGALVLLAVLGTANRADDGSRRRSLALKSGNAIMQDVLADAAKDDFDDFLEEWGDPANQAFRLTDLRDPQQADGLARAIVAIDSTDPLRVGVTVTVDWEHRGRREQLVIPYTLTELVQ